jgi:hypothetical protein
LQRTGKPVGHGRPASRMVFPDSLSERFRHLSSGLGTLAPLRGQGGQGTKPASLHILHDVSAGTGARLAGRVGHIRWPSCLKQHNFRVDDWRLDPSSRRCRHGRILRGTSDPSGVQTGQFSSVLAGYFAFARVTADRIVIGRCQGCSVLSHNTGSGTFQMTSTDISAAPMGHRRSESANLAAA